MLPDLTPKLLRRGRSVIGKLIGLAALAVLIVGGPATAFAQAPVRATTGISAAPATISPTINLGGAQNPFFGGVTSGQATPGVIPLSLREALDRGLKYNLGVLTSQHAAQQAQGARLRTLSELLPTLNIRTAETVQQVNLAALGVPPLAGIPPIVGPFSVFDARGLVTQTLLDFQKLNNTRAATQNIQAAEHTLKNARDLVVLVVGGTYLQAIAAAARIEAVQAQLKTAESLFNQAQDLKRAGMVAGIDVLRAQVEHQSQQQRLLVAQNEFDKQKLGLARAIGLPLGQQFTLTDTVPFAPAPPLMVEEALERAYRARQDYQAALAVVRAAEFSRKAAQGGALPVLQFNADYGLLGRTPGNSHGTMSTTAGLKIPIFQGGKVRGDVQQAEAVLRQRQAEAEDLRGSVEFDVRTALFDVNAAEQQVQVATSALALSRQALAQAQDRFTAGVTNNIEVVQAQESLAGANENLISALFAHNVAKLSLARALGIAEEASKRYLGGQ
jgi:outer membrane protein TolC